MNRRILSVLLFGFVFAGGATTLLYRMMIKQTGASAPVVTHPVFIAARKLEAGQTIQEKDLLPAAWQGWVPPGAIVQKADAVGRSISAAIYEGEPVVEYRLAPAGSGGGLAAFIPVGMRASAVRVNEVVGVAGFVLPGSHVDVLASGQQVSADSAATGPVTRTVLQNITVLSVGQDFKKDGDGKPVAAQVVNLLVSPQQAEVLSLAGNQTTIQLILRNALDTALVDTPGAAMNGLFGGMIATAAPRRVQTRAAQEPARPPAVLSILPAHIPDMVDVIQGTKRMEVGLMQPGVTQGASK